MIDKVRIAAAGNLGNSVDDVLEVVYSNLVNISHEVRKLL
jgi:hypothetical protein